MDITNEFEYLSPYYETAAIQLLNNITTASSLSEIRKHFHKFCQKYTTVPFIWQKWLEYEEKTEYSDFNAAELIIQKKNIINEAKKHFCNKDIMEGDTWMHGINQHLFLSQDIATDAANFSRYKPTSMKVIEKTLEFPNFTLTWNKKMCAKYGTRSLPLKALKAYQNSKNLLEIFLKDTENATITWWCKKIEKFCDKHYIIRSYEYKLGECPHFRDLWKSYINFLSNTNLALMLTVYSRYCRLFIDDYFMINEYIQRLITMNITFYNVSMWWIDVIEFYRNFYTYDNAKFLLDIVKKINKFDNDEIFVNYIEWFYCCPNKDESPFIYSLPGLEIELEEFQNDKSDEQNIFYIKPNNFQLISFYHPSDAKIQQFSLHFNYIYYILRSSNSVVLQRLFQSCKYFFIKQQKLFCYRFGIFDDCESAYFEESLFLNTENLNFAGINGITVTNMLQISSTNFPNATSLLLEKINCEMILHLQLYDQKLTESEFEMLSGNKIETVFLRYVTVLNNLNQNLKLENIVEKFPLAYEMGFTMLEEMFVPETAENLAKLNRTKNITKFTLINAPQTFNEFFATFILKFVYPKGIIKIKFSNDVDENYRQNFHEKVNEKLCNYDLYCEVA